MDTSADFEDMLRLLASHRARYLVVGRYLFCALLIALCTAPSVASDYVVRPGDTLSGIAESQLGSAHHWRQIAEINGLEPPYKIRVGQTLRLPGRDALGESAPHSPEIASTPTRATLEVRPHLWIWPLGLLEARSHLWIWALGLLVVVWLLGAVCVRIGCWFSLVETSFNRCFLLSLLLSALLVLGLGIVAGFGYLALLQNVPFLAVPVAGAVLLVAYVAASVLLTRRILQCKWRSVITVGVMAKFVADLLAVGLFVLLLTALRR